MHDGIAGRLHPVVPRLVRVARSPPGTKTGREVDDADQRAILEETRGGSVRIGVPVRGILGIGPFAFTVLVAACGDGGSGSPASSLALFAGDVTGASGSVDGTGSLARFNLPNALATDGAGNVYVADTFNHTIRKITPAGVVTTLAGTATVPGSADGPGATASFNLPIGVATDSAGNVYVADLFNNAIRKVTPTGVVSTLAGAAASFNLPSGV